MEGADDLHGWGVVCVCVRCVCELLRECGGGGGWEYDARTRGCRDLG